MANDQLIPARKKMKLAVDSALFAIDSALFPVGLAKFPVGLALFAALLSVG